MSFIGSILSVLSKPNKAAKPFLAASALISLTCHLLKRLTMGRFFSLLGRVCAVFFGFCLYFFRDPRRVTPRDSNAVVAPADGKIVSIDKVTPPPELDMGEKPLWRIGIFLSVLNVHVNRMPVSGTVTKIAYHAGQFLNASVDKASDKNERNALAIQLADGTLCGVVQIAGFIARRIICDAHIGDHVQAGEHFGIICFGSRTDLYLPEGTTPIVEKGQTTIGAETIVAYLHNKRQM